jgi:tRNA(fMet)-specific endonuclease VapC
VITEAELRTGAAKSASAAKTVRLVENFLRPLAILEFASGDAAAYAHVRAKLERAGTPIGPLDTLIAAQAVARRLVLVSNNEPEFGRIGGLPVQNWAA